MAVVSFGPWVEPGRSTAADDDDPEDEWNAAFGQVLPSLTTGTALDEFTTIYRALAQATTMHGSFSPDEVDRWDITTVAVVLGVDMGDMAWSRGFLDWTSEYDEWMASEGAVMTRRG